MTARMISTAAIAALLLTGTALAAPKPAQNATESANLLTAQEAETAALAHAGLTAAEVTDLRSHEDREKTVTEWDVEFRHGDWEYEYDLHAGTGEVLHWDRDYEPLPAAPTAPPEPVPTEPAPTAPPATEPVSTLPPATEAPRSDRISAEKAKAIALAHAGLKESDVKGLCSEFDYDDGRPEYEVEFRSGGYEYDYEIHAETGKILDWGKEWDD